MRIFLAVAAASLGIVLLAGCSNKTYVEAKEDTAHLSAIDSRLATLEGRVAALESKAPR
jgi:outer membrane murein-binding lipoprotein Lpp